jgi:predicted nucleotide-binding protein
VTAVVDPQFVVHVFAPAEGPDADDAYRALAEIWRGCELLFGMTDPVPGTGLPRTLPTRAALAARAASGESALAVQQHPGTDCQAVLRLQHDVFNLSIGLVTGRAEADPRWWQSVDYQWNLLSSGHARFMLGEARLYLAKVAGGVGDSIVFAELSGMLPAGSTGPRGPSAVAVTADGLALREASVEPDDRALRRLVLEMAPDADPVASAWVWSAGDATIPPLARYLLHAAKMRFELRVWQRYSQARRLRAPLDRRRREALLLHAELRTLRRTVEVAADNLGRCFDLGGLLTPGTVFADDAELAKFLLERLDDEIAYLGLATERAELRSEPSSEPSSEPAEPGRDYGPAEQLKRNVFVVYGRDEPARRAVFDFLRALDLRPLEWEALVKGTGTTVPFLSEAVLTGLDLAPAVVVLMTPEDVVHLHPELHEPNEKEAETRAALQARPNVLLELGMALVAKPAGTLVLLIGKHRPVTDLGGLNFISIADTPDCRRKIAARLKQAGCLVDDSGNDWLTAGDFASLTAHHRTA